MHGSSRTQRLGWHLLLALFMLLMQHGALRHAYQHTANDPSHPAHGTLCTKCLSYAATDAVAPGAHVVVATTPQFGHQPADHPTQHWTAFEASYQSRAPPRLSVQA